MDPKVAGGLERQVGITPARLPDQAQVSKLQGIGGDSGHGGQHFRRPGKLPLPHQPIPGEIEFASLLPGRVPPGREFGEHLGIRVPGQAGRHPSHAPVQGDGQGFLALNGYRTNSIRVAYPPSEVAASPREGSRVPAGAMAKIITLR